MYPSMLYVFYENRLEQIVRTFNVYFTEKRVNNAYYILSIVTINISLRDSKLNSARTRYRLETFTNPQRYYFGLARIL